MKIGENKFSKPIGRKVFFGLGDSWDLRVAAKLFNVKTGNQCNHLCFTFLSFSPTTFISMEECWTGAEMTTLLIITRVIQRTVILDRPHSVRFQLFFFFHIDTDSLTWPSIPYVSPFPFPLRFIIHRFRFGLGIQNSGLHLINNKIIKKKKKKTKRVTKIK